MIHEVDSALRTLIERDATGTRDVEIVFDAPTRDWAGRRNSPTIDVYLYDIREDLRRRERGMHNVYDESNIIISRHLPPRHFKLSYLVTAWTQRPEDEHRLLSSLLTCFLQYDALPADVLTGPLTDLGLPIPITIALPPPEDRAFADVWSALGGELKPSIDLVVITPLDTGQQFHTGPPVQTPPQVSLGGSYGWPTRETKSRNGVVAWPEGTAGPTVAAGPGAAGAGAGARAGAATRSGRSGGRRASGKAAAAGRGREDDVRTVDADDEETATGWAAATGWASAMAPLGPGRERGPVAGRAAGPRRSGHTADESPTDEGAVDGGPVDGGDTSAATGSPTPNRRGGATRKSASGSSKSGGRPGTRVAISRTRQTKKDS